jgi:hypothetical protein
MVLLALTTVALGGTARGQDQGSEFHWQGKLNAHQLLETKNINGDIDTKSTTGDQAQVTRKSPVHKPIRSRSK